MATNTENEIYFNFTYYALKLLGKNMYSNPWSAISELVANGLDAGAKRIYVLIDMAEKKHSRIEIFDNGTGMSYDDLCNKYTMIGRNKRDEIEEEEKGKILGRKGIGKLAALYLSKIYYLSTKINNRESTWVVDSSNYRDNDQPSLRKADKKDFISKKYWDKIKNGTMIELSDVDLKNIGEEKIKSLKTILADYYLFNKIEGKIFVCVLDEKNRKIEFEEVTKKIFFSTMYAIFDNTGLNYCKELKKKVYLTKPIEPKELDVARDTEVLLEEDLKDLSGIIEIPDVNGRIVSKTYELKGWIGIHSSIDESIQKRNDAEYEKLVYRGNSLRLYVRNKLAVDNFIKYLGSTQALTPYIEGEICFDILDDDELEDISTSNREGYPLNDSRVKKLIEIVSKIVKSLMNKRSAIGTKINEEIVAYRDKERKEALLRERNAFALAQKEKAAREKAEREKKEISENLAKQQEENKQIKRRLFNAEKNFTKDGEVYKHGMHLAVNFAKEIRGDIVELVEDSNFSNKIVDSIMEIDRVAEKIERLPNTIEQSSFSLNSSYITENLVDYVEQYLEIRNSRAFKIKVDKIVEDYITEFDFSDISMIIENIVSNAKKAGATTLIVKIYKKDGFILFDFINNGSYLDEQYSENMDAIFNYGESSTNGFGIGCYHIKKIIEMMGGSVSIFNNSNEKGVTFRVVLGDGKI